MVTKFPGAEYRPLAAKQGQPKMTRHDLVILHTMVGNLTGTDRMFKGSGWTGTESHFGVGGRWGDGKDGVIYQWQDADYRADANLEGNWRALSIETGDNAPARVADLEPWTPKQLDAIVAITAWACKTYDIPAVLVPDSKPGRRGIAYHRQGCEHSRGVGSVPGFLVAGGERWSTSKGKECPGPARIAQIPGIVARVKATLAGPTIPAKPVTQEVPEMQLTDKVKLSAAAAKAMGKKENELVSVSYILQWGGAGAYRELSEIRALAKTVAGQSAILSTISSAVTALAANSPEAVRAAFAEGVAELKTELAAIDVRVTLGPDETE